MTQDINTTVLQCVWLSEIQEQETAQDFRRMLSGTQFQVSLRLGTELPGLRQHLELIIQPQAQLSADTNAKTDTLGTVLQCV